MSEADVIDIAQVSIYTLLKLALPLLMVGLTVGLIVAVFQTLTQIQEQTLTFIPKIVAIFLTMIFLTPWMINSMQAYMDYITDLIINTS